MIENERSRVAFFTFAAIAIKRQALHHLDESFYSGRRRVCLDDMRGGNQVASSAPEGPGAKPDLLFQLFQVTTGQKLLLVDAPEKRIRPP